MNEEIWVLGATGRVGAAVAEALHDQGFSVVLAGRSRERVVALAERLGGQSRTVVGNLDVVLRELGSSTAAIVVNTVGPFTETAPQVIAASPAGTHYVDISNELTSIQNVLDLAPRAVEAGGTFVAGAGFGVLATEGALRRICAEQPRPSRVRIDAIPSVATEEGTIGIALARSIIEGMAAGGGRFRGNELIRTRLGAEPARLTTPDGDVVSSGSMPSGELVAAWRASGAGDVVAASAMAPTGHVASIVMAIVPILLRIPGVTRFAADRLARIHTKARPRPRPHSWGHARAEWPSGEVRESWLRIGDGMSFTVATVTEVTRRLAHGEGRPGAFTPAALFGTELAEAAGGVFVDGGSI